MQLILSPAGLLDPREGALEQVRRGPGLLGLEEPGVDFREGGDHGPKFRQFRPALLATVEVRLQGRPLFVVELDLLRLGGLMETWFQRST
ncbi:MAG: hypothetical protein WKF95_19450, partial [Rubrobacter sp.]